MNIEAQTDQTLVRDGKSIIFTNTHGEHLRLTPYGSHIIRVQTVHKNEVLFAEDRYEMVETHQWPGQLILNEEKTSFKVSSAVKDGISVLVNKTSMHLSFFKNGNEVSFLADKEGTKCESDTIRSSFKYDPNEHFTGLGHGYFGREESIDLSGRWLAVIMELNMDNKPL